MSSISTGEIASIYNKCTCKIFTYSDGIPVAQGSGVLLAGKRLIVTNYHTFIGSNSYKVILLGKEIPNCKIIFLNGLKDLTLIYIGKTIKGIKNINLNTDANVGDKVYTFGFPLNYGLTMTEGIVSNLQANLSIQLEENEFTKEINQREVMQITAPISQGSSGGALVNDKGELIGITTYSDKAGMGINFAIPIKEALADINEFEKLKADGIGRKEFIALEHYCLGINLMENSDFKKAYKYVKKAYDILPNYVNILINLSVLAVYNDDFINAAKYIDELSELEGMELYVIRWKTLLYLTMEKYPEAIRTLNVGIKLFPNNQYLYYNKALAYFEMKKYTRSLKMIDKSIEIDEDNDISINFKAEILEKLNDLEGALGLYGYLLSKNPNDKDLNFKLAELNSALGYNRKSLEYMDNLIRIDETNYLNFHNRAMVYYLLEDYNSAIEDLFVSIKLNPNYAPSYYIIALCYSGLDNHLDSIKNYTKCIKLDPGNIDAINNRGMAFMDIGNFVSAISDFKTVVKKSPDYTKSLNNIAICYQINKEYQKAQNYLNMIIKQINPEPSYYVNRAVNFYNMGQTKKALADFAKAESLDPENPILYEKRATYFWKQDCLKESMKDADKLINISPSETIGYLLKGAILLEQKKYNEALKYVDKAIHLGPGKAEPYFLRGEIYSATEKYEKAMTEYAHSIKLDDTIPDTYFSYGKVCKIKGYDNFAALNFEKACIIDSTYNERVKEFLSKQN